MVQDESDLLAYFDDKAFSMALDRLREERGLSMRDLAKECGVSPSTITRVLQGKFPDMDTFASLVTWAQFNPADFIRPRRTVSQRDRDAHGTLTAISTILSRDERINTEDARLIYSIIATLLTRLETER